MSIYNAIRTGFPTDPKNDSAMDAMSFLANSAQGDGQTRITSTCKSIKLMVVFFRTNLASHARTSVTVDLNHLIMLGVQNRQTGRPTRRWSLLGASGLKAFA
jgi:hypothetical protein